MRSSYLAILLQLLMASSVTPVTATEESNAIPTDAALQQNMKAATKVGSESSGVEVDFGKVLIKINLAEKSGCSVCSLLDTFYAINKAWHSHKDAQVAESRLAALSKELDELLERVKGGSSDAELGIKGQIKLKADTMRATLRKVQWKINLAWGNGVGIKTYCEMFNSILAAYCAGQRESLDAQVDTLVKALDSQLNASKNIRESLGLCVATIVGMEKDDFDSQAFIAYIQRRIKLSWYPPKIEGAYQLKTTFLVQKTGDISDIKIENPSKTAEFNDAAVYAIRSAGPVLRPEPKGELKVEFTFGYRYQKPKALPPETTPSTTRFPAGR